jgi:hypothetical protein
MLFKENAHEKRSLVETFADPDFIGTGSLHIFCLPHLRRQRSQAPVLLQRRQILVPLKRWMQNCFGAMRTDIVSSIRLLIRRCHKAL